MKTQVLLRRFILTLALLSELVGFSASELCSKPFSPIKRTLTSDNLRLIHSNDDYFVIAQCQNNGDTWTETIFATLHVEGLFFDENGRTFYPFTSNDIYLGNIKDGFCQTGECQILFWEDDEGYPIRWGISIYTDHTGPIIEQYLYPNLNN